MQPMLPCFCLCFCLWGRAPRGSRNACQQELIFSVCCQALLRETGPHFLLGLLSHIPGLRCLPPPEEVQENQGTQRVWLVWASPSSAYMWVPGCHWQCVQLHWLGGSSLAPTQGTFVTSPRLVLLGSVSANTHASACPGPHQYQCLKSGEVSQPTRPSGPAGLTKHLGQHLAYSKCNVTALPTLARLLLITALR